MLNLLKTLFRWLFSKRELPVIEIEAPVAPVVSPHPEAVKDIVKDIPKYLWDTPEHARHSVRVICDEEGLSVDDKDLICHVINCESGFKTSARKVNVDRNGKAVSTDYGICQMNSYWYIGANRPIKTIDEAVNDPEKCVRVMIKRFKEGGLRDWVCYSSGLYKKY